LADAKAAMAYRWDAPGERLVLETGAPLGQRTAGSEDRRLGEGPVGRAALTPGRVVTGPFTFVTGTPRGSARLAPVDGRGTIVASRVTAAHDELLGVLAVVVAGQETQAAARVLSDAARLISLAIDLRTVRAEERRAD